MSWLAAQLWNADRQPLVADDAVASDLRRRCAEALGRWIDLSSPAERPPRCRFWAARASLGGGRCAQVARLYEEAAAAAPPAERASLALEVSEVLNAAQALGAPAEVLRRLESVRAGLAAE